jgi:predicted lipase
MKPTAPQLPDCLARLSRFMVDVAPSTSHSIGFYKGEEQMYYPPGFDKQKAIELGNLVQQAYQQRADYKKKPWQLQGPYDLVCTITYNPMALGFDAGEDTGPTLIDQEIAETEPPGSEAFGLFDQYYPMGFVAASKDGKDAYLIFRGTQTGQEFVKDAKILWTPYPCIKSWGNVALGFSEVYMACRESFLKSLDGLGTNLNLYIGGHSLGGALTMLAQPDVIKATHFTKPIQYNFAGPRVGDRDFVAAYNALPDQKTFRIVNSSDIVPAAPPPAPMFYSHIEVQVDFNTQTNSVGGNHVMETYLTALGWKPGDDTY